MHDWLLKQLRRLADTTRNKAHKNSLRYDKREMCGQEQKSPGPNRLLTRGEGVFSGDVITSVAKQSQCVEEEIAIPRLAGLRSSQ